MLAVRVCPRCTVAWLRSVVGVPGRLLLLASPFTGIGRRDGMAAAVRPERDDGRLETWWAAEKAPADLSAGDVGSCCVGDDATAIRLGLGDTRMLAVLAGSLRCIGDATFADVLLPSDAGVVLSRETGTLMRLAELPVEWSCGSLLPWPGVTTSLCRLLRVAARADFGFLESGSFTMTQCLLKSSAAPASAVELSWRRFAEGRLATSSSSVTCPFAAPYVEPYVKKLV